MRLADIVTVDEIVGSMDGTKPREGVGKESSLDLKPLCRAFTNSFVKGMRQESST